MGLENCVAASGDVTQQVTYSTATDCAALLRVERSLERMLLLLIKSMTYPGGRGLDPGAYDTHWRPLLSQFLKENSPYQAEPTCFQPHRI